MKAAVAAGDEVLASIAGGAMLYDASYIGQPEAGLFEPEFWATHGALETTRGGRGTVAFVRTPLGQEWVLRHYRRGGLVARVSDDTYIWRGAARTRAFREWRLLRRLRGWNLPVPRPIAARYVRRGPFYRADLLTEELPSRRTLAAALAQERVPAATWTAVGRAIARLHAHCVQHADLNAHNLVLGGTGSARVYVLDFDRGRIRPQQGKWEQQVLDRLHRSLRKVCRDLPPDRFDADAWRALLAGVAG